MKVTLKLTEKCFCAKVSKVDYFKVITGFGSLHNIPGAKRGPKQGSQELAQKFSYETYLWPRLFVN